MKIYYEINMIYELWQAGQWFSLGTPVSTTNKTDRHDKTEILLKVQLNTTTLTPFDQIIMHIVH
jgi:hypothetical protein